MGGVLWATTFVVLGDLAGASYQRVERIAGRASLLLVVAIALVVGVRWVVHRVAARREWLRAIRDRALARPAVRWMTGHWGTQLDWLGRRLDRRARAGLGLTITVSARTAATWAIGVAVQDLLAREELALLDGPVNRALAPYRTVAALDVARIVLAAVEVPWVGLLAVVLAGSAWRASGRAAALRLVGGAALTVIVALALRGVLPVTSVGTRFPSVQTTVAAAFSVSLTTAFARRGWAAGTRAATAATVAVALVAFAALVDTPTARCPASSGAPASAACSPSSWRSRHAYGRPSSGRPEATASPDRHRHDVRGVGCHAWRAGVAQPAGCMDGSGLSGPSADSSSGPSAPSSSVARTLPPLVPATAISSAAACSMPAMDASAAPSAASSPSGRVDWSTGTLPV